MTMNPQVQLTLDHEAWWLSGGGLARTRFALASAEHETDADVARPDPLPTTLPTILPVALTEHLSRHAPRATVLASVASRWVRVFVLPFSPRLDAEARWDAFALARFEQLFGESAEGWQLAALSEPPPHPRLAAALPAPLLAGLRAGLGKRLLGVRAEPVVRVQTLRAEQPRYTGALVELAPDAMLLTLLHQGVPQRVRLRRGAPDPAALQALLHTEWAALSAGDAGLPAQLPQLMVGPTHAFGAEDWQLWRGLAPRVARIA
jgi:hypothetical protein